jgi:hypothetical protein
MVGILLKILPHALEKKIIFLVINILISDRFEFRSDIYFY